MTTSDQVLADPRTFGVRDDPCYVYAIVPADARIPDELVGIGEQRVGLVRNGQIAAVVGAAPEGRPLGRRLDLIAHMRVVDALAARGPAIPVRFGSVLDDAETVGEEFLGPNSEYFTTMLAYLTGRRQFIVRARYDEETVLSEVVVDHPDIARLRDRTRVMPDDVGWAERVRLGELVSKALEAKRVDDARFVLEHLTPHVVEWNVREPADVDYLIQVALLVDDDDRRDLEAAAESVAEALAGRARVQLLGPSAPYDFVPEA